MLTTEVSRDLHVDTSVDPQRTPLLELRDVSTTFRTGTGPLTAVNGVSFTLERGKIMAVIGESGSGKSALLRTILGIQPSSTIETGEVRLDGVDLLAMPRRERGRTRGRLVSMVFQDPMTALNPVVTIEKQLTETLRRHMPINAFEARKRALELLDLVQIPSPARRLKSYPHEMSGGMRQRVVIAMALACEPVLLLADEPTTALDVTVQARILELMREIQRERDMSVLIVTHDLAVAAELADDVGVMYAGHIVEYGTVEQVILEPHHPYTRGLLGANVAPGQLVKPVSIPGAPPNLARLPSGCSFAPRCDCGTVECWQELPALTESTPGRLSRCIHTSTLVAEAPVLLTTANHHTP